MKIIKEAQKNERKEERLCHLRKKSGNDKKQICLKKEIVEKNKTKQRMYEEKERMA